MIRDEHGFTLIELLVGMTIGMVVLIAALGITDFALPASKRVTDRTDANQLGRNAMEQVLQDLRSNVCVQQANNVYLTPFTSPTDATQVTFYSQVFGAPTGATPATDPGRAGTISPNLVTLKVAGGTLSENTVSGVLSAGNWTWPGATRTRVLEPNVRQVGATPYFTYWAYDATTGALTQLPAGTVVPADLPRIVKVSVSFLAGPQAVALQGIDHFVTLTDDASSSLPVDFTSNATAALGPKCTF